MVTIYKLPSGDKELSFGGPGSGSGQFKSPERLCFLDAGSLLIADSGNKRVQQMTISGTYQRTIGTGALTNPVGVTSNGYLIVVSQLSPAHRIVVFQLYDGRFLRSFGDNGSLPRQLKGAAGMCLTKEEILIISEIDNRRLSRFKINGQFVGTVETDGAQKPSDVCVGNTGEMIVAGFKSQDVIVFSPDGSTVVKRFGSEGNKPGQFKDPFGVAFAQGRLYVLDFSAPRVQVFE